MIAGTHLLFVMMFSFAQFLCIFLMAGVFVYTIIGEWYESLAIAFVGYLASILAQYAYHSVQPMALSVHGLKIKI
jgi:uncharacterized membrane protein YjjP (DUF1212 family)